MLEDTLLTEKIIFDEPMKKHTSFKIGGKADFYVKVSNIEELKKAIKYGKEKSIPLYIIGNGSNILVTDKGIRGLVIQIDINKYQVENFEKYAIVTVGAGNKLMALAMKFQQDKLTGFEELSGIPGTIGGAIYMNAGAYGKEIKDSIISTTCMDFEGNIFELSNIEQEFSYRNSIFNKKNYIILETKMKLSFCDEEQIKDKMESYLKQRKEKQPLEYPSAGSTFKRIEGKATAKLIDECGLKGYKIGGAKISEKHAGFIVNEKNAKAKDVLDLINYVKEKINEKYGIKIEEEIKVLGDL